MEQIVNPALFAWSKALRVVPVGGRDDDDEDDGDSGGNVDGDSLVLDQTQLYDNESCGPGLVSCCIIFSRHSIIFFPSFCLHISSLAFFFA